VGAKAAEVALPPETVTAEPTGAPPGLGQLVAEPRGPQTKNETVPLTVPSCPVGLKNAVSVTEPLNIDEALVWVVSPGAAWTAKHSVVVFVWAPGEYGELAAGVY